MDYVGVQAESHKLVNIWAHINLYIVFTRNRISNVFVESETVKWYHVLSDILMMCYS